MKHAYRLMPNGKASTCIPPLCLFQENEDHVHLVFSLKATHCLAEVMRDVKSISSRWVHDQGLDAKFEWQEGYYALTVSPSQVEDVRRYVRNQVEHHRKETFQEEYIELLEKSGTRYDPKYLW